MKRLSVAVLGVTLLWVVPAVAHHSFAAEFDENKPITLTGKLSKMEWTNPHGWLYIDVEENGKTVTWAIEAGAPNTLLRRGLRKTDFPIGSVVVVEGFRAKNGSPTANGRTVKFSDGRNFFLGAGNEGTGGAPQ